MSTQTGSATAAVLAERQPRRVDPLELLSQYAAWIVLIILAAIFAAIQPGFLSAYNLLNIMRQVSITGIIAVGMTFVILTAGIDLSVGAIVAISGMTAAAVAKGARGLLAAGANDPGGIQVLWAALAAMGVGLLIGALQGGVIAKLGVPAFVVTLGGLTVWRGAALILSDGQPISNFSKDFTYWGKGSIGRLPVLVLIFLAFVLVAHIVLRYTQYGRWIYAVGGNPEAARLSGLPTTWLIWSVYVISGFCTGLAGFLLTSRLNSAQQTAGDNYELTAIAAVVIGGTSLFGGEGRVVGTLAGAMLIGVISNGMTVANLNPYYQYVALGVIIVIAVFFDRVMKRRRR
jgi:ribose/xylose/arabinose/galactoside ABC-type transport system permease subunit